MSREDQAWHAFGCLAAVLTLAWLGFIVWAGVELVVWLTSK